MAITTAVCHSFKTELLKAIHDFTPGTGDVIKMAFYSVAPTATATAYSATNEISGGSTGLSAGGVALGGAVMNAPAAGNSYKATVDYSDVAITSATFTARGVLVYNSSKANRAILACDFGADQVVSAGTFTVTIPGDGGEGIVRVG